MFENLTEKLTSVFGSLGNKGRLTEKDVDEALREVRLALLDADVNFKVARSFVSGVKEKVMQDDQILHSISAGQQVVKVTNDALIDVLGGQTSPLKRTSDKSTVILMVGLNGSGKTTTAAKLAKHLTELGEMTSLVAADVHRPAAVEQLRVLGSQINCDVFDMGTDVRADHVASEGVKRASSLDSVWTIVDTAGRFQVDDELMLELENIRDATQPDEVLLVVDAMTGQESVSVAEEFHSRIGLTGLVLTKMDGDARGGAALSITSVTGIPVKFIGLGERIDALDQFHPDRLASRILGMGDVLSLVEKAQKTFDEDQAAELEKKVMQATFDLEDFLEQMQAVKKMGPISQVLEMLPGFSSIKGKLDSEDIDGSKMLKSEAIIRSMTMVERQKPELISGSRRRRIARGSGTSPQDVNQLLNQFKQVRKMMKQFSSPKGQQKMMKMMSQKNGNPFGF
jgi:signal recognition particle subunit SRP54